MHCLAGAQSSSPGMRCLSWNRKSGVQIMAVRRRSIIAIGVFVALAIVVAASRWYETRRAQPGNVADTKVAVHHVTNAGDRGPGTLREALFIVAGATSPSEISIEIPAIKLETALPALVNGRGVRLVG